MSESTRGLDRRTFLTGAAALGAAVLLKPALAFAEPTAADKLAEADAVRARIVDMQAQLDVVTEQYYKALDEHAAAQQAVADAQARIDEATAQIAGLQEKLGSRARSMYRTGQSSVLDFIMGAATFEEFAQNWDLLEKLNDNDASLVQQTKDLRAEVQEQKTVYAEQERVAAEKANEAKRIEDEAAATVSAMQATYDSLSAEAAALLEQERAAQQAAERRAFAGDVGDDVVHRAVLHQAGEVLFEVAALFLHLSEHTLGHGRDVGVAQRVTGDLLDCRTRVGDDLLQHLGSLLNLAHNLVDDGLNVHGRPFTSTHSLGSV